jgi:hypothetical protein
MTFWDKAHERQQLSSFIDALKVWQAEGCYYYVSPFTSEERKRIFNMKGERIKLQPCSQCHRPRRDAAPLYTIASAISFQEEVLAALDASNSEAEFNYRLSRIIEQEGTPMVCKDCCPCKTVHNHGTVHAFPA